MACGGQGYADAYLIALQSTHCPDKEVLMRALLRALPLLLLSLAVQAAEVDRRIAVTIDDLPWARVDEIVPADLQAGAYGGRTCRATTPAPPRRYARCGRR